MWPKRMENKLIIIGGKSTINNELLKVPKIQGRKRRDKILTKMTKWPLPQKFNEQRWKKILIESNKWAIFKNEIINEERKY